MTDKQASFFFVAPTFAALFALATVVAWPGYGQGVKRTTKAQPTAQADTSVMQVAGQQNAQLMNDLEWVFGGKVQRGWAIYVPLIAHTLETDAAIESSDFARAVARWQRGARLPDNGVLGSATFYQLLDKWQSRRLKERGYPSPDQLVTAPPTEFYDPAAPDDQRQVERATYAAYKRMLAAAAADRSLGLTTTKTGELAAGEKYLKLISAFRSRERQEQLRKQEPQAGRAGLAVNSPHFTGRALDLYVGGDPVSTKDANRARQTETRVYRWLVKNAERFGFRPYFFEPWHWEYVGQ